MWITNKRECPKCKSTDLQMLLGMTSASRILQESDPKNWPANGGYICNLCKEEFEFDKNYIGEKEVKCHACGSSKVINTGHKVKVGISRPNHEPLPEQNEYKCEDEKCGLVFYE